VLLVLLLALFVCGSPSKRLIELSESNRTWFTETEIESLAAECGKADEQLHGGFFDVTDHPTLNFTGAPQPLPTIDFQMLLTRNDDELLNLLASLQAANIKDTIIQLSTDFPSRYYQRQSALDAATAFKQRFQGYIDQTGRSDVSVKFFPHQWLQPSVIARIECSSCAPDAEAIILGAHIDSTATNNAVAPGADDDASGSATMLEVFRALVHSTFKPPRPIEFHGYSAEEVGLRGSQDIAALYQSEKRRVRGMMQLDMTGFAQGGAPALVLDYTNAQLTTFASTLANKYSTISWTTTKCGYGCSDHASWTKAGYPSVFPFESVFSKLNSRIHTASDQWTALSPEHALQFARLALAFAYNLATE